MAQKVMDFFSTGILAFGIAFLSCFFGALLLAFCTLIGYLGMLVGIF